MSEPISKEAAAMLVAAARFYVDEYKTVKDDYSRGYKAALNVMRHCVRRARQGATFNADWGTWEDASDD